MDVSKIIEIKKRFKLEESFKFLSSILDERVEAKEIGLNKHQYKKLKTEIMDRLGLNSFYHLSF
jgi:hypothetical protein